MRERQALHLCSRRTGPLLHRETGDKQWLLPIYGVVKLVLMTCFCVVSAERICRRPAEREAACVALAVRTEDHVDIVSTGRQVARQFFAAKLAKKSARRVGAVVHTQTIGQTVPRVFQIKVIKTNGDYLKPEQQHDLSLIVGQ